MFLQRLIATELEIHNLELLADFGQTGHAEILAFQQIVASLTNQFANRIELQSNHAFPRANRKIQVRNWTV